MISSNRIFCLYDQMVKCGLCLCRHLTKNTDICWDFSPANKLKVRLLNKTIDLFDGLFVATLTQEHSSNNCLFFIERFVLVLCPFFKYFPRNLSHQTSAITSKAIIIASTSMLVAVEGLDALLKNFIWFDSFEIGNESNSTSVPFSEVGKWVAWDFIAWVRDLEIHVLRIFVFWKSSHHDWRSWNSRCTGHHWERPCSKSQVLHRRSAHPEIGFRYSRHNIYGSIFTAIFIIMTLFLNLGIRIVLKCGHLNSRIWEFWLRHGHPHLISDPYLRLQALERFLRETEIWASHWSSLLRIDLKCSRSHNTLRLDLSEKR